ncbi:serine/threonine-protein kinase [Delftia acidovorans]|uniref:serine/threonine-protein kinase n=1 Tax=Delftia acidovorans TaxID=80866 RepID=UPI00242F757A|nr:serine/threonine-protein kinase [Delftia acidovorans]
MEFDVDEIIDQRFKVERILNDSGGMGKVLLVKDCKGKLKGTLALKYCKENSEEHVKRFRREVRLLRSFDGNSKIVEVLANNIDHDPPYFVMKFYPEGDLTSYIGLIQEDTEKQERLFNQMVDCINELHSQRIFHRDIKPQNFLRDGNNIVASDFGLGMEADSATRFTESLNYWGTQGYLPPEFQNGGFKHADEAGDIFMLGKTFYVLLTGQSPTYLMEKEIHPAVFHVIDRACERDKTRRYQTLAELKQALKLAFDVIIGRGGLIGEVSQLIAHIQDRLDNENKYQPTQFVDFIEKLALLKKDDQIRICTELKGSFIATISQGKIAPHIPAFLKIYREMVEAGQYPWAFAEKIADNMREIFDSPDEIPNKTRADALELAIEAAHKMNRYAAMNTCTSMITSVTDETLGAQVATVIQKNRHDFIKKIETSQCKCDAIRKTLNAINS